MLKQQVHGPHVVLLAGNMERCEAILGTQRKYFTASLYVHNSKAFDLNTVLFSYTLSFLLYNIAYIIL